jgi:hypothetical protein
MIEHMQTLRMDHHIQLQLLVLILEHSLALQSMVTSLDGQTVNYTYSEEKILLEQLLNIVK